MESFGIIVVGPIWGLISVQLFFQTGEEAIKAFYYLLGILKHKVEAKKLVPLMLMALVKSIGCALLLVFGFWLICVRYADLRSDAQDVLYLAFALLAVVYVVSQLPYRLRKAWRHAMIAGTIEEDAAIEAADEAEQKEIDERGPGVAKRSR